MSQPLWRMVQRFLNKVNTDLLHDPTIPLLDLYPEKDLIQKGNSYPDVHCSTVYKSQDM